MYLAILNEKSGLAVSRSVRTGPQLHHPPCAIATTEIRAPINREGNSFYFVQLEMLVDQIR